jgi:hypothetical protein
VLLNDNGSLKNIKNFLEINENENTTYQNLWNTAQTLLRENFIAINVYIRIIGRFQIYNQTIYLKDLESKNKQNPN